ncbi:MAG: hypothetical protein II388_07400 [Clostridia bacterium]|nr:hypothetical protein [Clostridia bacterium]
MAEIQFNGTEWEVSDALQAFYTPYASYVVQTRALPDARDGLKTGARFILFAQYKNKLTYKDKKKKAVATVNAAMRFSPHGDASILGTAVRMSQNFSLRYPIMEVYGNNGSYLSGDDYSQARYLEMRGGEIAYEMTKLLDKDTVDTWKLNYTQEEKYPTVLPSKFPYALVNGSFGIGVACSSSVPPHCITDVCDAVVKVINNPEVSFEEIYCPIDFPTGGTIINEAEVKESLKTGHGSAAIVRAKIDYDDKTHELIVTEMPYMTFTASTVKAISNALDEGLLEGIESVYDGTDKRGCRIYIQLNKKANPKTVINKLYKHTPLQNSFSINMNMLDKGVTPKLFSWKESIEAYVTHLRDIIIKAYQYDLKKLKDRIHIIEGLILALAHIDEIIALIKSSSSTTQAKELLVKNYILDEIQADAILKMRLSSLTHLEIDKLIKEKNEKERSAREIEDILASEERIKAKMIEDVMQIKKKYGDSHRTINTNIKAEKTEDAEIAEVMPEDVVIILTQSGKIKRISKTAFKTQRRNTKGIKSPDAAILDTISTNTIDTLMFFTTKGKMYRTLVDNIPVMDNKSKGADIGTIIGMESDEEVIAMTSLNRKTQPKYVCFITAKGLVKKTELKEYMATKKSNGIAAIKIGDDDSIANVTFLDDEDLVLVTKQGYAIHFETTTIAPIGRVTKGVKSIKLGADDEVLVGLPIKDSADNIGIFVSSGYGKQFAISEIPLQGRGGKGIIITKANENVQVVGAIMLSSVDNLLLLGKPNNLCISGKEVPVVSRTSLGNIMIKNSVLQAVVKL